LLAPGGVMSGDGGADAVGKLARLARRAQSESPFAGDAIQSRRRIKLELQQRVDAASGS
jgi:hypothetical protein